MKKLLFHVTVLAPALNELDTASVHFYFICLTFNTVQFFTFQLVLGTMLNEPYQIMISFNICGFPLDLSTVIQAIVLYLKQTHRI